MHTIEIASYSFPTAQLKITVEHKSEADEKQAEGTPNNTPSVGITMTRLLFNYIAKFA